MKPLLTDKALYILLSWNSELSAPPIIKQNIVKWEFISMGHLYKCSMNTIGLLEIELRNNLFSDEFIYCGQYIDIIPHDARPEINKHFHPKKFQLIII